VTAASFLLDGLRQAAELIVSGDHDIAVVVGTTLRLAFWSTLLALAIGLPLGLALGLGRFRGRRAGLALANAGMGLPPVVVGLVVALLLFRGAPLGGLNLLYTFNGMVLAQTLLGLPLVAALTAAAVQALPGGLFEQAHAFGASRAQVALLALREARIGVLAATIAAMGSAFAEVGAIVLVGGNLEGETQTLASAVLVRVSAGEYGRAIALGTILLGLILVLAAGLTLAQQHERRALLGRPS
jgi:tungstate transport system permease protein